MNHFQGKNRDADVENARMDASGEGSVGRIERLLLLLPSPFSRV